MSFHLSRIPALDGTNVSTVGLADLLNDPEWHTVYMFNYMYDLPWLVQHFNPRSEITLHTVYGWKPPKDEQGPEFQTAAKSAQKIAPNVTIKLHGVRLVNRYATHHSKIIVLISNSALKIVIHTANMIEFDWGNMTQGLWVSPLLSHTPDTQPAGNRFRGDFARYLNAYNIPQITQLAESLMSYDFTAIHDTLIASVPGSHLKSAYGLRRLKRELADIPVDEAICQVSSIATLPATFLPTLARSLNCSLPGLRIVFPTMANIERSLNGWLSGASLHLKRRTSAHDSQYSRLKPHLRQWEASNVSRSLAAPHIKTYTGITDNQVQYFLLTSANLSTQAWGTESAKTGALWVQSWECGVLRKNGNVELPYDLPLTQYGPKDSAWSPDTFANAYL